MAGQSARNVLSIPALKNGVYNTRAQIHPLSPRVELFSLFFVLGLDWGARPPRVRAQFNFNQPINIMIILNEEEALRLINSAPDFEDIEPGLSNEEAHSLLIEPGFEEGS